MIRAEEHLPNTPKQQLLWEALGHEPPIWAHVPVVVNEKRQKLSKRRDKVALEAYRDEGYLADAMRNYLMLLGWAPTGDREIVPWTVIEEEFRLEDVNPSPAFFDEKKLRAFNGEYIRALSSRGVHRRLPAVADRHRDMRRGRRAITTRACSPPWPRWPRPGSRPVGDRGLCRLPLPGRAGGRRGGVDKAMRDGAAELLSAAQRRSRRLPCGRAETLKTTLEEVGTERGLKLGKTQAPVRVAVTGRTVGLPLFESIEVLGRDRTLERVRRAADTA